MTVNKDIPLPSSPLSFPAPPTSTQRPVPLRGESSISSEESAASQPGNVNGQARSDFTSKPDNADNAFMEEVSRLTMLPTWY
jgi:hypothetical protein